MATSKATADKVISACIAAAEEVRRLIPYDTGNMSKNSFRYTITDTSVIIYMDESQAPYVPYTNEKWISPRRHGRRNPNEGWWQNKVVPRFAQSLASRLGGDLK